MSEQTPRYAELFNEAAQQGEHMDDCECWKYVALNLDKECARLEQNAERFKYLQNIPVKDAQAFFWNFSSRRQRAAAIDRALAKEKK